MAAADGLALYRESLGDDRRIRPGCRDRVRCEWQEDWVLYSGDTVELVSGKHRDPSEGAYTTVVKLADDGGLAHLFNRWAAMQEKPLCRLVTLGGLSSGPPRKLLAAARHFRSVRLAAEPVIVKAEHADIVTDLRNAIATYCHDTRDRWVANGSAVVVSEHDRDAEVGRFLVALTISEGQIQRDHVGFAAPAMYAQPILDRLGVTSWAAAVWEAVLKASTTPDPDEQAKTQPNQRMLDAAVASRLVEMDDLDWKSELPPARGLPQTDFPKDVGGLRLNRPLQRLRLNCNTMVRKTAPASVSTVTMPARMGFGMSANTPSSIIHSARINYVKKVARLTSYFFVRVRIRKATNLV